MTDRGQTFTLEAFVAAILLLGALAFALHAVTISTNTASAGDTEGSNQLAGLGQGVLDQGVADGTLAHTLLYWNETTEEFYGADVDPEDGGHYISQLPQNETDPVFGQSMGAMFDDRHVRYNIDLFFRNETGYRGHQRLVESGTPGDDAIRVVATVTLYNDTALLDETGNSSATLEEIAADPSRSFYAPDIAPESRVYTVIRIEVELWRT